MRTEVATRVPPATASDRGTAGCEAALATAPRIHKPGPRTLHGEHRPCLPGESGLNATASVVRSRRAPPPRRPALDASACIEPSLARAVLPSRVARQMTIAQIRCGLHRITRDGR